MKTLDSTPVAMMKETRELFALNSSPVHNPVHSPVHGSMPSISDHPLFNFNRE